jgi:putative ABC transport system permease protein
MYEALVAYFKENKKRMLLSIAGVAIGVISLTVMLGVTGAMRREVLKALGSLGADVIVVIPGEVKNLGGRTIQLSFYPTLTMEDASAVREKCALVKFAVPFKKVKPAVHFGGKYLKDAVTMGVTPEYERIAEHRTFCGRFLSKEDVESISQVAVIGAEVARELYRNACPVGRNIYLFNAPYTIVGVLEKKGTDVSGENLDMRIYIPITSAVKRISNVDYIDGIYILPEENAPADDVLSEVQSLLLKRHAEKDFTVSRYEDVVNTRKQAMEIFSKLSIIVAVIAFGVGSLGILAVMTLSVYERLTEIGIRRAYGARKIDIFLQFLGESTILSLVGAVVGVLTATGVVFAVSCAAGWSFYLPLKGTLLSFTLSIAIGLTAGIYPAVRATSFSTQKVLKS